MELLFFLSELHEVSFNKLINLAVHHALHIAGLVVGAMVFDAAVIEDVGAYLRAPFYLLLACLNLISFFETMLQLLVIQL